LGDLVLVDYGTSGFWPCQITRTSRFNSKDWRGVEYFGGRGWDGVANLKVIHAYDDYTKENLHKFISKEKMDKEPMLREAVQQINEKLSERASTNNINYGLDKDTCACLCRACSKAVVPQKETYVMRNVEPSFNSDESSDDDGKFFTPNTSLEEREILSNADEDLGKLCENLVAVALNDDDDDSRLGNRATHLEEALLEQDNEENGEHEDFNLDERSVTIGDSHSEEGLVEKDNEECTEDENGNTEVVQTYSSIGTEEKVNKETDNNVKKTEADILSENNNELAYNLFKTLDNLQIEEKRRSTRRTESELLAEETEKIVEHLRKDSDDGLGIEEAEIPGKGRGIVATRDFKKGEFVVEHAGKLISKESANAREEQYGVDKGCCYMFYFVHQGKNLCIDETEETGRLGRLLNHSRKHPNLDTKVIAVDGAPRLYMVAKVDIKAGVELLFDYGETRKEVIAANPWLNL